MTCLELSVESPEDSSSRQIVASHFPFRLGRALQNDLPMPYLSVSGRHLAIEKAGDNTVSVTDLNSTNGTFIDNRPIPAKQTVKLELPVRVRLGEVYVTIRRLGDGTPDGFTMAQSSTQLRKMVDQAARQADDIDDTMPFFEVLSGPGAGRRFALEPAEQSIYIGTGDQCEVTLNLSGFPERIARVFWRNDRCWLVPETAGVEYDGDLLDHKQQLRSGDRFAIGSAEILFFDPLEQDLEVLQPGIHQRTPRRPEPVPTEDLDQPDISPDDDDVVDDTAADDSAPETDNPEDDRDADANEPDTPSSPTDDADQPAAQEPAQPAGERILSASAAGFGAIELALLIMSVVFLVATMVLFALFLTG